METAKILIRRIRILYFTSTDLDSDADLSDGHI